MVKLNNHIELPDPETLLRFQVKHYSQRLSAASATRERSFLRCELYNFKQRLLKILN